MSSKKEETASFVIRFTQKVFKNEKNEPQVQWRGNIRHVQGGDEKRFSEFEDVVKFIQAKLGDLTLQAMEGKSVEDQKGILAKSFDLWKKMAIDTPKMVIDTLIDPKEKVAQLQNQINQFGATITEKVEEKIKENIEIDEWRTSTKSDMKDMMKLLEKMSNDISKLNKKVEALSKKS